MYFIKDEIVFLIGAGPGDPGLITIKGKECISEANCIVYDYLASKELLKYKKDDAEVIYVGKKGGDHTLSQDGINELLVQKAKEHKIVARLKGGDPFIFGRGGEEAEFLLENGINFEIIPGVTSAIAAPAYAGIPLTHRDFTSSVSIITGHEKEDKSSSSINWQALGETKETLVFLMGVKNLPNICSKLKSYGKDKNTPVALVHWGTTNKQRVVVGDLTNIEEKVLKAKITAPSIIIVGKVVDLRKNLNWFETKPLFSKKIIITRARVQASSLKEKLNYLGANCIEFPVIKPTPTKDTKEIDTAINSIKKYDWLIFTSVNGVKFFFKRVYELGKDVRLLGSLKTACIGPATRDELLKFGIKSDILPKKYVAESVIEAFKSENLQDKNILLPRAKDAREILPVELKKMGANIDEIIVYYAAPVSEEKDKIKEMLVAKEIDYITFTSSSTVQNFKSAIFDDNFEENIKSAKIITIGPITTETAKKLGFTVFKEAQKYTIDGLIEAIVS